MVRQRASFLPWLLVVHLLEFGTTLATAVSPLDWHAPYGVTHFASLEGYLQARFIVWTLLLLAGAFQALMIRLARGDSLAAWVRRSRWAIVTAPVVALALDIMATIGSARFCCMAERSVDFNSLLAYAMARGIFWFPAALVVTAIVRRVVDAKAGEIADDYVL